MHIYLLQTQNFLRKTWRLAEMYTHDGYLKAKIHFFATLKPETVYYQDSFYTTGRLSILHAVDLHASIQPAFGRLLFFFSNRRAITDMSEKIRDSYSKTTRPNSSVDRNRTCMDLSCFEKLVALVHCPHYA